MNKGILFRFRLPGPKFAKQTVPLSVAQQLPRFQRQYEMAEFDATQFETTVEALRLFFRHYMNGEPIPCDSSCQSIFDLICLGNFFEIPLTKYGFLPNLTMSVSITMMSIFGASDDYQKDVILGFAGDNYLLRNWDSMGNFYTHWTPMRHRFFPDSFRRCTFEFMLCWKRVCGNKIPKEILIVILNNFIGIEDKYVVTARNFSQMPPAFQHSVIHSYIDRCFGWVSREGRQQLDLYTKWETFFFDWPFLSHYIQQQYFTDPHQKMTFIDLTNTPVRRRAGLLTRKTRKEMLDYLFSNVPEYVSDKLRSIERELANAR